MPITNEQYEIMRERVERARAGRKAGVAVEVPLPEREMIIRPSTDVQKLNKTERAYYDLLEAGRKFGRYDWVGVQSITLKLGDDCRYTPDLWTLANGILDAHEVKGFWRDDAKVKIKTAARMYPFIRFYVVSRQGGQWKSEEVKV